MKFTLTPSRLVTAAIAVAAIASAPVPAASAATARGAAHAARVQHAGVSTVGLRIWTSNPRMI